MRVLTRLFQFSKNTRYLHTTVNNNYKNINRLENEEPKTINIQNIVNDIINNNVNKDDKVNYIYNNYCVDYIDYYYDD